MENGKIRGLMVTLRMRLLTDKFISASTLKVNAMAKERSPSHLEKSTKADFRTIHRMERES